MNCQKCGSLLPPGAQFCNLCNEPVMQTGFVSYNQQPPLYTQTTQNYPPVRQDYTTQGYPPVTQNYTQGYPPVQGYGNPPTYPPASQQGYPPTQPAAYPQGYQPVYGGYSQPQNAQGAGAFISALSHLPRMFIESFRNPGLVLRGMMERKDIYTAPVVLVLVLAAAFFCAVVTSKGGVSVLMSLLSSFMGRALASRDGINSIANNIGTSIGGIAVLCQLLSVAFPVIVSLIYLCVVCKVRFSSELLCGFITIPALPTLPVAVLTMLGSLLSPVLPLLTILSGTVISYIFITDITAAAAGKANTGMVKARIVIILASTLLSLAAMMLVVSLFSGNILNTILIRVGLR